MTTEKKLKTRTTITIDPDILATARDYCQEASRRLPIGVLSFSELVETLVKRHLESPAGQLGPEGEEIKIF